MADTATPNYNWILPEISGSAATWGNKLNSNFNAIDAKMKQVNDIAVAAMPKAGNTDFTGPVGLGPGAGAVADNQLTHLALLKLYIQNASPRGIISEWGGTIASIPAGWALCNGAIVNGVQTPNLIDRFIVAAGFSYAPGNFGGTVTHNHGGEVGHTSITEAQMPFHAHAVADPGHNHGLHDPGHAHSYADTGMFSGAFGAGINPGASPSQSEVGRVTTPSGTGMAIFAAGTGIALYGTGGNAGHTHGIASADHRPPFYALAYIMRVKYPWEP